MAARGHSFTAQLPASGVAWSCAAGTEYLLGMGREQLSGDNLWVELHVQLGFVSWPQVLLYVTCIKLALA